VTVVYATTHVKYNTIKYMQTGESHQVDYFRISRILMFEKRDNCYKMIKLPLYIQAAVLSFGKFG